MPFLQEARYDHRRLPLYCTCKPTGQTSSWRAGQIKDDFDIESHMAHSRPQLPARKSQCIGRATQVASLRSNTHSSKSRSFRPTCLSRPIPDTELQEGSAAKTLDRPHEPRKVAEIAERNMVFSPDASMPLRLTEPCHLGTLQDIWSTQSVAPAASRPSGLTRRSHSLLRIIKALALPCSGLLEIPNTGGDG